MPRRIIFIIVGIAVLAAAGVAGFLLSRSGRTTNEAPPSTSNTATVTNTTLLTANTPVKEENPELVEIVALAKNFTERYGSYSTEEPQTNLEELLPWMTAAYRTVTERDLARLGSTKHAEAFFGVTTKALAPEVTAYESGERATVDVTAQRSETREATRGEPYHQTLTLTLLREDGTWKVQSASWKPIQSSQQSGG